MLLSPYIFAIIGLSALFTLCVAYLSKSKERNSRLKKIQIAKYTKRAKKLDNIIFGLPPYYLPKTLKVLIYASIVDSLRQMHSLSGAGNIEAQISRVKDTLATLLAIEPKEGQSSNSADQGIELRECKYLLKDLHSLILEFHREGTINRATAESHLAMVRQTLLRVTLDTYKSAAEQSLQKNNLGLAHHYYSMAVQRLEQDSSLEGMDSERQFFADKVESMTEALESSNQSDGLNDLSQEASLAQWQSLDNDESWKKQRY